MNITGTAYVFLVALVAAAGGFLFGFDLSIASGALPFLKKQFGLDVAGEGLAMSSAIFGSIAGPLAGMWLADRAGRRNTLWVAAICFMASAIGTALPRTITEFNIWRAVGGIGTAVAEEFARRGYTVGVVGRDAARLAEVGRPIESAGGRGNDPIREFSESMAMLGRWGRPEEVAKTVVWIASDEASYLTGTTLVLDGGWSRMHMPPAVTQAILKNVARGCDRPPTPRKPPAEAAGVRLAITVRACERMHHSRSRRVTTPAAAGGLPHPCVSRCDSGTPGGASRPVIRKTNRFRRARS